MYFKVLNDNGAGMFSNVAWALPRQTKTDKQLPGRWMPKIKRLVVCESGYHLTDEAHLVEWPGPTIYVAEGRGDSVDECNTTVFAQARLLRRLDTWDEKSARLFAADVAEHVLPIFEARFPNDFRPRNAIAVARAFANGQATEGELKAAYAAAYAAGAAYAAAYADADAADAADAAYAAANAARAAYAAANAVRAAYAAAYAAYAAANAADAAADAAARAASYTNADVSYAAGYATERKWQTARLMECLFPK